MLNNVSNGDIQCYENAMPFVRRPKSAERRTSLRCRYPDETSAWMPEL
jgi:hypothetical protein